MPIPMMTDRVEGQGREGMRERKRQTDRQTERLGRERELVFNILPTMWVILG